MLKNLIDAGLGTKAGITIVTSPFVVKILAMFQWIDINLLQIGVWLSALLTLTLLIGHWVRLVWQSRKNKEDSDRSAEESRRNDERNAAEIANLNAKNQLQELEKEELRLKVELLKLELKEKQEKE